MRRGVPYMPADSNKPSFPNILLSLLLVIASLYWTRAVLIPFALALLLTFLLQPIVAAIHRQGLSRTPAAVLVVVLVALVVFGGPVIRGFTIAMIWGVVIGTYSTIYISTPVLVHLNLRREGAAPAVQTP